MILFLSIHWVAYFCCVSSIELSLESLPLAPAMENERIPAPYESF